MRIRIERLRVWLLVSAGLLVVVIAGFIGTARYLRRHWLAGIPAKLGAGVRVDTSGVTYSHTYQGHTDYVIHAARDVEHTDGKVELNDVWMKLCGRRQQRADMVRGDKWEWDKKAGVVRALGVVHIQLRPASGKAGCAAVDDEQGPVAPGARALQVTTSDLIYMQALGVAATSAPIEFDSGTFHGHAVGADYASDTGTLMLHSAVSMAGMSGGQPVQLQAAAAELDGQERVVRLNGAKYVTGAGTEARNASADRAVLYLRENQMLERIEAEGNVTMQAAGGTVSAAKANVAMNAAGHPVRVLLTGGVRYLAQGPQAERRGEAQAATIAFDGKAAPQAQHAVFTGAVHFAERARQRTVGDPAKSTWSTRELSAAKVEVSLAPDGEGKNQLRDAEATGGARFSETGMGGAKTSAAGAGAGPRTTEIAADDLQAHFGGGDSDAGSPPQLEEIAGRGHTLVRQVNAKGVEQASAGDTLDARFRPASVRNTRVGADLASADALAAAVQTGHVAVTRREAAKSAKRGGDEEHGTAQRASYDGDTDRVTLSGGVQLEGQLGQLWANQVVLERATGNAQATGSVRAEYFQAEKVGRSQDSGPAHLLAQRADLDYEAGITTFHGSPVRMWQEGSQVEAPVIEIDRAAQRLIARAENATGWANTVPASSRDGGRASQAAPVRTVLMSARSEGTAPAPSASGTAQACPAASRGDGKQTASGLQAIRIASGGLVYSKILGEAEFTGGLRMETADAAVGTIRADSGTVYLKDTKGGAKNAATPNVPAIAGDVDRIVASGRVLVDRPALRASGEKLICTTADQNCVLTGDAKTPPRATDARGSTTTGAALEFHRGCGGTDDTVEALGSLPGGTAAQVHTESHVAAKQEKPMP